MATKRDRREDEGVFSDEGKDKKVKVFEPSRSVYIGNINAQAISYFDLCQIANEFGQIELIKIVPHKGCAFINFLDEKAAHDFIERSNQEPIKVGEQVLKVSWGKATPLPEDLQKHLQEGATRNLFVGNVYDNVDEDALAQAFAKFGPFENIVILREKKCAFVNLTSLRSAVAAKGSEIHCGGRGLKIGYAKEKVGSKPGGVRRPTRPFLGPAAHAEAAVRFAAASPQPFPSAQFGGFGGYESPASTSRGIYLGNIQDDIQYHDLCKLANRFGQLESVKIVRDKQCAFLNFIDGGAAHAFFSANQSSPLNINKHVLKVNWAKSGILSPEILSTVRSGGTRNLFVGNIEEHINEDILRSAFGVYGEIDLVSILHEKKIAFINFTSIQSAISAKNALQGKPLGEPPISLKINFAKEVAAPGPRRPRAPPAGGAPPSQ